MDKMTPTNSPLVTKKHDNHMEDKMSKLPDEILVRVLSHLLTKEAARTSVLSRRWVKLWTFVPILKFDRSWRIYYAPDGTQILRMEKTKIINCVNQALKSHRGQTIEEFIVHFDLVKNVSSHIDSWIDFAKNRRVQRLELGFSWRDHCGQYTFPLWAVKFSTFNSLTDLCLSSVDVSGEVLEHLLFNCRNLERLCIAWSTSRVSLKVSGLPLKLKNLEIYMCNDIESIDISATNLESFRCFGNKINIPFNNFPALVTASFEGDFGEFVTNNFCQLSSYFTRLEALTLEKELEENTTEPLNFAVLSNVKHLELRVSGCSCRILPFIISIIKAFPSLHRFVLRKYMMGANIQSDTRPEPTKSPYKFLKVVELLGFDGSEQDVEIAMYFIANAVSMETLVFDTRNQSTLGTRWEGLFQDVEEQQAARNCARQLGGKLPLETRFVVI